MEQVIHLMLKNGEICIVKLFDYMLDAISKGRLSQSESLTA